MQLFLRKENTMNKYGVTVMTVIGAAGGVITNFFGGWTDDMTTLIIFMAIDLALGFAIAGIWKKSDKSENGALSSWSAWKGIIRKGALLAVILIAYRLDLALGTQYIKTACIIAFIASEALSIIENLGIMGVPLPTVLTKAVDVLKSKGDIDGAK